MFIPYPKIKPVTETEYLEKVEEDWIGVKNTSFSVQEKLDGLAVQIVFSQEGKIAIFGKDGTIKSDEDYRQVERMLENKYAHLHHVFKTYAIKNKIQINLYGILVSPEYSRINYGTCPKLRFFDVKMGGNFLPPREMAKWFGKNSIDKFLVPMLKSTRTLKEALDFDPKILSCTIQVQEEDMKFPPDTIIAGVVIKPAESFVGGFKLKRENVWPKKYEAPVMEKIPAPEEIKKEVKLKAKYRRKKRKKEKSGD